MVRTFDMGTRDEKARKVMEECAEFFGEHTTCMRHDEDCLSLDLCMEIGDVLTALLNYCDSLNMDAQSCVDMAYKKNRARGRYAATINGGEAPAHEVTDQASR